MKKLLKRTAIFAALVLAMLLFAACSDDDVDVDDENGRGYVIGTNGDDSVSLNGDGTIPSNGYDFEIGRPAPIVPSEELLQLINENTPVATINGIDIGAALVASSIRDAEMILMETQAFIEPDEWQQAVLEQAVHVAALPILFMEYAAEHGLALTEEYLQSITEDIDATIEEQGLEMFTELLSHMGFYSRSQLEMFFRTMGLMSMVVNTIIEDPEMFAPFEEYVMPEPEILAAKHILIMAEHDFESEEAAMEFAQSLHARIIAGESFDELMHTYSDDAGGLQDFPEGYTWAVGAMDPAFEAATREIAIGEMSEPFWGHNGIHFVLRLEPDMDNIMRSWWEPPPPDPEVRKMIAIYTAFEVRVVTGDIVLFDNLQYIPVS